MFKVWDFDKDGYVNIRDFVHTFAYAQLVYFFFKSFLYNRDLRILV